ncbi:MAG: acetylxylan esterase [Lentisphaerae bacterium]|jgi:hypothetical protein|nr:acetylxylan esterase [Lentisphaerota bacterium]MBT4816588.1 acetylxylan esterase [Lentisphaerota bacterium]MBT5609477.1 acetylxylan esterase [Lentisphaerota bacterium]MBT7057712.1 acetylxylan esterase [Lentisphaerota bacterium]MBT7848661.1 acetylxylan esterase [Lentisphaerota bacterium]
MSTISQQLSVPSYDDFGDDLGLTALPCSSAVVTSEDWEKRERGEILARWRQVLGSPEMSEFDNTPERLTCFELPEGMASVFRLPTSPVSQQLVVLLEPRGEVAGPRPGAVIPFYNPDLMVGYDIETREPKDAPNVHFGRHLVQQGYVVVCGQAFPYNTVPDPLSDASFAWWHAAAAKLHQDHPRWTGIGRLAWDTRIATDFLLDQAQVDPDRIAIMGHSLGGKMAFYAGCLDERIKAVVASDFGIAFGSTNWDAPWYLGDLVNDPELGVGHHDLLALLAPRSFLILAGFYDGPVSWQFVDAVRPVYELYGCGDALGILDHATGHRPPLEALEAAYAWLAEQFELPRRPFTI